MTANEDWLIADIGGTNARFAIARDGRIEHLRTLPTAGYPTMAAAAREFLAGLPAGVRPRRAALDVAGPVKADFAGLTNSTWSFVIEQARAELGLDELIVLNDFTAAALGIPYLSAADLRQIGGGERDEHGPIGLIGPGTGLGVGGLLLVNGEWGALPSEGGHVTMSPTSEEESRVLEHLRGRFGHVSAERVVSGQGLENLYETLTALRGAAERLAAAEITARAESDPVCGHALELFFAMLGVVAGNLALTLGAAGGVFVTGGIVPRCADAFARSSFRAKFEQKGRLTGYMQRIPTYLITHFNPALVGLAELGRRRK